jgi:CubicO group peptidase (beta-lactamase class C family)
MRVVIRTFAVLTLLALAVPSFAGAAEVADPSAATFDAIAARASAKNGAPGFAFVVVHRGRTVYARGFGLADVARNQPVTPDTRFVIGSVSKQFTAAAVLQLRDAGKLRLDDPLARYLPAMPNANAITLRMLLNQTSGLHNYPSTLEHEWPLTGAIAPERIFAILATDRPDFEPGARFEYSNTNYAALAGVVARASGMTYDAYLHANIFAPLGMSSSGAGLAAQKLPHATPYTGTTVYAVPTPIISLDLFYGAGSVVVSANDLARWDTALMHGALLAPRSMHDLWTPARLESGRETTYAMGFVPQTLVGHREVWHNGLSPNAGGYCYNALFPDDDLGVIVLSNGYDFAERPETIVREVIDAYFLHRIPLIPTGAK